MKKSFILFFLSFFFGQLSAQKQEAENAVLTADAVVVNSPLASAGSYVQMKGGNLSFSVNVVQAGLYTMDVVFSQTYGDSKVQNLSVNGVGTGSISFPKTGSSLSFATTKTVVRLDAGNNSIDITNSWGWVDIDYIELSAYQKTPFQVDENPVTPSPTEAASKLYSFLRDNFQHRTISGVMTGVVLSGNNPISLSQQPEVAFISASSGKMPALVGFDFMHSTGKESGGLWYQAHTQSIMAMAEELWKEGGIPAFCWHWRDPLLLTNEFYPKGKEHPEGTDFDLTTAFTDASCTIWNTNSDAYKGIVRDIDIVSGLLKQLQDKNIAVLWRPIHEASGGWFWWGAKGAVPFVQLYKLMFDRMVNLHELHNLIWVWNSDGADADWYPGDEYVDIIGRDFYFYPREKNHSSLIGEFEILKNLFGTKKIISLAENGSVPYPENMKEDGADWSYFMPWYGNYVTQDNTASDWNLIMNNDYVITLEDMPGWDNYGTNSGISAEKNQAVVYPTQIKDMIHLVLPDADYRIAITDSSGRLLSCFPAKGEYNSIFCDNWDKGVFFISITGNNATQTFKVIK